MTSVTDLFGENLVNNAGETIKTESALANKRAIGIYFSAHWCPPCRGFTPKLAEAYKEFASDKGFEIVFVSSDKDEASFTDYHKEMPWLALPFSDRDRKGALSKKYKVSGIPSLVIIDGSTLKTITDEGREAVSKDPHGANFPWVPPTLVEALGTTLVGKNGLETTVQSVFESNDAVGLYFSAHWCGPCRHFTPKLTETYNKLKAEGKHKFEVIFVSSDQDQSEFDQYYGEMPWLALPFADRQRKSDLSTHFGVEGIPSFVVVDKNYKVVNGKARGAVTADPEGLKFPWAPEPVGALDSPDGINDTPALVLFAEKVESTRQAELVSLVTAIAKPIADKAKADDTEAPLLFFAAKAESGVASQVRRLTSFGEATSEPQLVLVDIPDSGAYYVFNATEITHDTVSKFVQDYLAGALVAHKKQFQS